ncbi:recombinase [Maribacter algarum]|uniref:Recombinase n=1 Tax=Maribacter algarum (ex Zhang et al. 2020) TaxID=2578118 RepID=A0A5S3PH86_9FLAO|nr:site-specific integrase [Maribacter algarum]TMM53608.1 recombinase [Maribacter algarum]
MATVQAVLRNKKNSHDKYPIAIRITKNRRSSFIYTGQYIEKKLWDKVKCKVKRSHPNSAHLNQLILTRVSEVNSKLLESEISKEYKSVQTIKDNIQNKNRHDFYSVAELYLANLRNRKQFHRYDNEKSRIERFLEFTKHQELPFNSITVNLLRRFETHLLHKKGLAFRTVMNYIIPIRTIYNLAIAESIADRNNYPFGRGKYQIKFPDSEKVGLNVEEVQLLENAVGLTEAQQHALNVWLLSFYFAGIRITDIIQLRWSDFSDYRLHYRMSKNDKRVSLRIPIKAKLILNIYRESSNDSEEFVFKELRNTDFNNAKQVRTRIKTTTRNFNRHLKRIAKNVGIDKNLSMHIARHTFGNISGDKIPIQMLHKLYRHSSITTTISYQANFMNDEQDEALDKVVNF